MRMRILLVIVGVVSGVGASARRAAADPDKKCYAGTQVETLDGVDSKTTVVAVREVDRVAKEIRQTLWSDRDPDLASMRTIVVDPDKNTFTVDDARLHARGTGTLDGKPWAWTHYRGTMTSNKLDIELEIEGQLAGDKLTIHNTGKRHGKATIESRLEASVFDCKQLDAKRAALDHASATAVRTCYEGTATSSGGIADGQRKIVIEQVVDAKAKTIELRRWTQGSRADRRTVFTIDGNKVAVTALNATGTGTITGKPGAWTDYTWTGHAKAFDVASHGTLGGATMTIVIDLQTGHKRKDHDELAATAFDCAKLGEHRDAVGALPRAETKTAVPPLAPGAVPPLAPRAAPPLAPTSTPAP